MNFLPQFEMPLSELVNGVHGIQEVASGGVQCVVLAGGEGVVNELEDLKFFL